MSQFGPAYDEKLDANRLRLQIERIRLHMTASAAMDRWETIREISRALEQEWHCNFPEASVSAQMRNMRKPDGGSRQIDKRRSGDPTWGKFEYILRPPEEPALILGGQENLFAPEVWDDVWKFAKPLTRRENVESKRQ